MSDRPSNTLSSKDFEFSDISDNLSDQSIIRKTGECIDNDQSHADKMLTMTTKDHFLKAYNSDKTTPHFIPFDKVCHVPQVTSLSSPSVRQIIPHPQTSLFRPVMYPSNNFNSYQANKNAILSQQTYNHYANSQYIPQLLYPYTYYQDPFLGAMNQFAYPSYYTPFQVPTGYKVPQATPAVTKKSQGHSSKTFKKDSPSKSDLNKQMSASISKKNKIMTAKPLKKEKEQSTSSEKESEADESGSMVIIECEMNNEKLQNKMLSDLEDNETFLPIKDLLNQEDIKEYFTEASKSKLLQKALIQIEAEYSKVETAIVISSIYDKIFPEVEFIMMGSYSNYFFQKLVPLLNRKQKLAIWNAIEMNILSLSINDHSNRSLQALISSADNPKDQTRVIEIIYPFITELSMNRYGTHVVQKIVSEYDDSVKKKVIKFICSNFVGLSNNQNGVCVIKKYIISMNSKPKDKQKKLLSFIQQFLPLILDDDYSVFIIVTLFEYYGIAKCKEIVRYIRDNIVVYATKEKCVRLFHMILDSESDDVSPMLYYSIY
jgi:hypothetical protein